MSTLPAHVGDRQEPPWFKWITLTIAAFLLPILSVISPALSTPIGILLSEITLWIIKKQG